MHNDSLWLDWMSDGLVAIGESYVAGLWEVNASKSLDHVVTGLMTIHDVDGPHVQLSSVFQGSHRGLRLGPVRLGARLPS